MPIRRPPMQLLTVLPTGYDGLEVAWVVDSTNDVVWHMKYRATNSKWAFLGGPPLYSLVDTSQGTTSATYVALTTAGPSITLPLAGDYDVTIGARIGLDTGNVTAQMSYDIGGTGAVDADALTAGDTSRPDIGWQGALTRRKTGLTAVTLTAKYKSAGGANALFFRRWMSVVPARI